MKLYIKMKFFVAQVFPFSKVLLETISFYVHKEVFYMCKKRYLKNTENELAVYN